MNISKYQESVSTTFEYNGETVTMAVRRPSFREASSKEFQDRFKNISDDLTLVADLLAERVASWDVFVGEGEDAETIPLEREALLDLPFDFLSGAIEAVTAVILPQKKLQTPASLDVGSEAAAE